MNAAQKLLLSLGVDPMMVVSWASGANPSFRKKGPGRKHQQGKRK